MKTFFEKKSLEPRLSNYKDYYYKYKALKYYLKNNSIEKEKKIKGGANFIKENSENENRKILLEQIKEDASKVFEDKVNTNLYYKLPNEFRIVNFKNWDFIYQYFNTKTLLFEFFEMEIDKIDKYIPLIHFFEKFVRNHQLNTTNIEEMSSDNNYYGIEIEGCVNKSKDNKDINLKMFGIMKDDSVQCRIMDYRNVEYVLKEKTKLEKLKTNLNDDIEEIKKNFEHQMEREYIQNNEKKVKQNCLKYCGIHFHFSNENIKLDLYGLLFLIYFFKEWLYIYQDKFIDEYDYECHIYDNKYIHSTPYNNKNTMNDEEKDILIILESEIMEKIKNKEFNNYIFIALFFTKLKLLLKNTNRSAYNTNYLWIVDDYEFIHFEFRGFISSEENLNNIISILNEINEISKTALNKLKEKLTLLASYN